MRYLSLGLTYIEDKRGVSKRTNNKIYNFYRVISKPVVKFKVNVGFYNECVLIALIL